MKREQNRVINFVWFFRYHETLMFAKIFARYNNVSVSNADLLNNWTQTTTLTSNLSQIVWKMGTGKGWSQLETAIACRAYQTASKDHRKGSGKKKELFTAQVLEIYETHIKLPRMTNETSSYPALIGEEIIQRFRKERCECIKFEGIIKSIKERKPTGSLSKDQF